MGHSHMKRAEGHLHEHNCYKWLASDMVRKSTWKQLVKLKPTGAGGIMGRCHTFVSKGACYESKDTCHARSKSRKPHFPVSQVQMSGGEPRCSDKILCSVYKINAAQHVNTFQTPASHQRSQSSQMVRTILPSTTKPGMT